MIYPLDSAIYRLNNRGQILCMAEGSPPWRSQDTLSRDCFPFVCTFAAFVVGRIKRFGRKLPCFLLLLFLLVFNNNNNNNNNLY